MISDRCCAPDPLHMNVFLRIVAGQLALLAPHTPDVERAG
jgi:hypothetical protein